MTVHTGRPRRRKVYAEVRVSQLKYNGAEAYGRARALLVDAMPGLEKSFGKEKLCQRAVVQSSHEEAISVRLDRSDLYTRARCRRSRSSKSQDIWLDKSCATMVHGCRTLYPSCDFVPRWYSAVAKQASALPPYWTPGRDSCCFDKSRVVGVLTHSQVDED